MSSLQQRKRVIKNVSISFKTGGILTEQEDRGQEGEEIDQDRYDQLRSVPNRHLISSKQSFHR
jgi:hypothetical protein